MNGLENTKKNNILIVDESGFSRICSAFLEADEAFGAVIIDDPQTFIFRQSLEDFSLVITSFPVSSSVYENIKKVNIPVLVLSDRLNMELIDFLKSLGNSYCMIKPLDYGRFKSLIKIIANGQPELKNGYTIT